MVNTPLIFMGISGISFAIAGLLSTSESAPGSVYDSRIKPSIERVLFQGMPVRGHGREYVPNYRNENAPVVRDMKNEGSSRNDKVENSAPAPGPVPAGTGTPERTESKGIPAGCLGSVSALADREAARIPRLCIAFGSWPAIGTEG